MSKQPSAEEQQGVPDETPLDGFEIMNPKPQTLWRYPNVRPRRPQK